MSSGKTLFGNRVEANDIKLSFQNSAENNCGEQVPVGLVDVENDPDPVVGELLEPEANVLDSLDEVIYRLGWSICDVSSNLILTHFSKLK